MVHKIKDFFSFLLKIGIFILAAALLLIFIQGLFNSQLEYDWRSLSFNPKHSFTQNEIKETNDEIVIQQDHVEENFVNAGKNFQEVSNIEFAQLIETINNRENTIKGTSYDVDVSFNGMRFIGNDSIIQLYFYANKNNGNYAHHTIRKNSGVHTFEKTNGKGALVVDSAEHLYIIMREYFYAYL